MHLYNPKSKIGVPSGPLKSVGAEYDRQLAQGIADGDRASLERLLDRHLGPVYGYVMRRLGPGYEDVAADVTSATFEEALRHLKPYASGSAPMPMRLWLLKLASKHLADEHISSSEEEQGQVPAARLRTTLRGLPRKQQEVFSLALFEELAPEEIAAASGLGLPRAMGILRTALKRLDRTARIQLGEGP